MMVRVSGFCDVQGDGVQAFENLLQITTKLILLKKNMYIYIHTISYY